MFSVMFCFLQEFYHPIHGWLAMLVSVNVVPFLGGLLVVPCCWQCACSPPSNITLNLKSGVKRRFRNALTLTFKLILLSLFNI